MSEPALAGALYSGRMDAWSRTTPAMLDELAEVMHGRVVEGITLHRTEAELHWIGDDTVVVLFTTVIDDPLPGETTWPLKSLEAIRGLVDTEALRIGIDEWISLKPVPVGSADRVRSRLR